MRLVAAGLAVASVLALSGCSDPTGLFGSGDSTAGYCGALTADRARFADLLNGGPDGLINGLPMLRSLADQAPPDINPKWHTFVGAVDGLKKALDAAGVKASDFKDGKPPVGLEAGKSAAIVAAANTLSSADTSAAATSIEQQARDVCHVNLGM